MLNFYFVPRLTNVLPGLRIYPYFTDNYLGLFQEYGRMSNVYSILRIFTVPLLRVW